MEISKNKLATILMISCFLLGPIQTIRFVMELNISEEELAQSRVGFHEEQTRLLPKAPPPKKKIRSYEFWDHYYESRNDGTIHKRAHPLTWS